MKQKRSWIILGAILAALLILYAGLRIYNTNTAKREARETDKSTVYVTNETDAAEISYTGTAEEKTMEFVKNDGKWYYAPDREIPMDQSAVADLADTVTVCRAVRELKEPDALSDYGLDDPLYTISFKNAKGTETTLYIGQAAGEDYYAALKGDGKVYTVESTLVSALTFDLSGFVQTDTVPPISSGSLKKVEVTENGKTAVYDAKEDIAELAGGFGALSFTSCADYHAEEEKLKDYGLDGECRVTVKAVYEDPDSGEEKEFTIYVGKTDDSGAWRYVGTDGSKIVYLVSADTVENTYTPAEQ